MVTHRKQIKGQTLTIEKFKHNGYLCISCLYGGVLQHKTYVGYTQKDAIKHFISEVLSI